MNSYSSLAIPFDKEKSSMESIERIFNYYWTTGRPYLLEAIQARGVVRRKIGERDLKDGNRSLAGFGDAVSDLWAWALVLEISGKARFADEIRQKLFHNDKLNELGRRLRLDELLITAPGTPLPSRAMVATMFEALIGAVFKDGGMEAVDGVMEHLGIAAEARRILEDARNE